MATINLRLSLQVTLALRTSRARPPLVLILSHLLDHCACTLSLQFGHVSLLHVIVIGLTVLLLKGRLFVIIVIIVHIADVLAGAIAVSLSSLALKCVLILFVQVVLLEVLNDKLVLLLQEVDVLLGRSVCIFLKIISIHLRPAIELLASSLLPNLDEWILNEMRLHIVRILLDELRDLALHLVCLHLDIFSLLCLSTAANGSFLNTLSTHGLFSKLAHDWDHESSGDVDASADLKPVDSTAALTIGVIFIFARIFSVRVLTLLAASSLLSNNIVVFYEVLIKVAFHLAI